MPAGKGKEAEIRLRCRQQQLVAAWRICTQLVLLLLPLAGDHPQEHLRRRDPRCPHAELHRFSTHHPQVSLLKAKLEGRWRAQMSAPSAGAGTAQQSPRATRR
jgi:hypothetical protein